MVMSGHSDDLRHIPLIGQFAVQAVNFSHDEPEDHSYRVSISHFRADDCPCPDHKHRHHRCKHMDSVDEDPVAIAEASALPVDKVEVECGTAYFVPQPPDGLTRRLVGVCINGGSKRRMLDRLGYSPKLADRIVDISSKRISSD